MLKGILFAALFLLINVKAPAQQKRFSFTEPKMGSPFKIVFYANDSMQATNLAKHCFNLVDSFIFIFSDYTESSELGRLNASANDGSQPAMASPALIDILTLSKTAFEKTGGAFDITIGPLVKLWRKARKSKQFPAMQAVRSARSLVGFNNLIIDTVNKKITMSKPGMQLDLGGIAQGYIAQKIIDFLRTLQIDNALVDASGDIVMSGPPPGYIGWTVGINVPEATDELLSRPLLMQNKAVTTSGDVYQFMENAGKRYSHIIDPRTGYGVTSQRNVTAIADNGVTADWLATACSILPVRKAKRLAVQMGAEVLIAEIRKGKLIFTSTKGFGQYWKPAVQ
ncbi:MAG: FAD:protein FMN transferase [Ferruginibacter sp.]